MNIKSQYVIKLNNTTYFKKNSFKVFCFASALFFPIDFFFSNAFSKTLELNSMKNFCFCSSSFFPSKSIKNRTCNCQFSASPITTESKQRVCPVSRGCSFLLGTSIFCKSPWLLCFCFVFYLWTFRDPSGRKWKFLLVVRLSACSSAWIKSCHAKRRKYWTRWTSS